LSLHTLDATFLTDSYVQKNKAAKTEKNIQITNVFHLQNELFLTQIMFFLPVIQDVHHNSFDRTFIKTYSVVQFDF
jgi:hypothetical protein